FADGAEIGEVTSGGVSPTVGKNIARAIVKTGSAPLGATVDVEIRGRNTPMEVVPHPFYKRAR
nr:glycine cleavage T C-terminal barrel domain-containing protein [Planctomycetota bacterium]